MTPIYWLIAFVILLGIELATMALTTIWFAGGAFVSFVLAMAGASEEMQLLVFVIVSFVLLFFTRPLVSRYVNRNTTKTNAEALIGKHARITVAVDNNQAMGAAVVNGQEWTARAADDSKIYKEGAMVMITDIKGVKLIVKEIQEET